MKKSSLFISAVLSSFILAVLAGFVTVAHGFTGSNTQPALQQSAPTALQLTSLPAQLSAPAVISPQAAGQIAAQFMGRSDLYSAESAPLNGSDAYKVVFSSGDVVYVSQQGQVLSLVQSPPTSASSIPAAVFQPNFWTGQEHEAGNGD